MCRCLEGYSGPKCKIYQPPPNSLHNITSPVESPTPSTSSSPIGLGFLGKPLKVKYPLSKTLMSTLPTSTTAQTSSSDGEGEPHRQQTTTLSPVSGRTVQPCQCLNGGRCISLRTQLAGVATSDDSDYLQRERCKCPPTHQGSRCQNRKLTDPYSNFST